MGVSYYGCKSCGESRYEEYVGSCQGCGNRLCTNCLVNDDIESSYAHEYGIKFDSNNAEMVKELLNEGYISVDEDGNYDIEEGELIDDSSIQPKYCPFCQGNEIDNDEVLNFLLRKFGLGLDQVWEMIKQEKKLKK